MFQKSDDYIPDEHVIAVCIDEKDNALSWFLGVVSTVTKDAIGVTYTILKIENAAIRH